MTAVVRVHQYGGPAVLKYEEVEVPAPQAGDIRIRQKACGVNYIDTYFRSGLYPVEQMPFVLGNEGAGEVTAVGEGVTDFSVGDRVAYAATLGGYAQERVIAADRVVKLPDAIGYEQAAAMMLKGMTARYLLRSTYPVKAGDVVLIHAAAGGVGLIACQWASALGATVIGTVGSHDKARMAADHGCHFPILYREEDFVARVKDITEGQGCHVVYDGIGQQTFMSSLDCLRPRGMMVSFGNASGPVADFSLGVLAQKGSLFVTRPSLFHYVARRSDLLETAQDLFDMVGSGKLKIMIHQAYKLKDVRDAHIELESRATTGSTVLLP